MKKKKKTTKERMKKEKGLVNPTLDAGGRKVMMHCFQDKIACLVACTLLDKHSTHFIICKKLGSTQI